MTKKHNALPLVKLTAIVGILAILVVASSKLQPEPLQTETASASETYIQASELEQTIVANMGPDKPLTIEEKIHDAAIEYGVPEEVALALAACESTMNPYAQNPRSTAKGLYQFTDRTWRYIKAQGHQFDADENIKQFMIWYPIHPEWWECE